MAPTPAHPRGFGSPGAARVLPAIGVASLIAFTLFTTASVPEPDASEPGAGMQAGDVVSRLPEAPADAPPPNHHQPPAVRRADPPTTPPLVLLSEGCPATADVRGNLGPPSVVTSRRAADWLKDRWQAAADMNGTPIPGKHWIEVDLQQPSAVSRVVVDFETAYSSDLHIFGRVSTEEEWRQLSPTSVSTHKVDDKHRVTTVDVSPSRLRQFRLSGLEPATAWGTSVWELQLLGRGAAACA